MDKAVGQIRFYMHLKGIHYSSRLVHYDLFFKLQGNGCTVITMQNEYDFIDFLKSISYT